MADVKWIKITTDVFDDEKILLIESLPEADSIIVIWFKLLCLAGKQNNSGVFLLGDKIAYTDKMLATIFRRKEATVQLALQTFEQFGMIELIDGVITIPNWGKHQNLDQLESKKEYMRNYMQEYRKKQKALTCKDNSKTSCKTNNKANVSEADKEEDKEIDKEEDKSKKNSASQPSKADIDSFFDSIWNLYPVKKGKGQVSDSKRKALFKIGFDEMQRAIDRYLKELDKDASWRKPQNGSTFFNSGYVDYLDANFVPGESKPQQSVFKKNQFNSYSQPKHDHAAMERMFIDEVNAPPKTAAEDESIRERAEALKKQFAEGKW